MGDKETQREVEAADAGSANGGRPFGHQGPNERGQTFGHEGPDVRAQTSGHQGPDVRAQTLGYGGPNERAQTFGPERGPTGHEENFPRPLPTGGKAALRDTQVVAIGNQKGGVCKSTLTVNLAAALGALGRKCLIIDLDANCGATRSLGVPTTWMGTFEALLGTEDADELILRTDPEEEVLLPDNVELLPANRKLEELDRVFRERRENKFRDPTDALQRPLELLRGQYDFIFLDTAPNAASPTIAAYKSAKWFLLSMTPDRLAYEALVDALTDILAVRDSGNPDLCLLGVVLSQIDRRTTLAERYIRRIRKEFGEAGQQGAFETTVSRSVVVTKANEKGQALRVFDPRHKVTQQFDELAAEFEARIAAVRNGTGTEGLVELVPHDARGLAEVVASDEDLDTEEEVEEAHA